MKIIILTAALTVFVFGCNKADLSATADIQETAQQVGDVMASVDESGGSGGAIGINQKMNQDLMKKSVRSSFARFAPGEMSENILAKLILPEAQAVACSSASFGTCNNGILVRSFAGCTVGSATFSGDVTLTWAGTGSASCVMSTAGESVTRVPNFTVTGRRSATLSVTRTGAVGQRITRGASAGTFAFFNDGINRKFVAASTTLFDQTTATSGDITVVGSDRNNRVMNGGSLNVVNNLTSVTCNYIPTNVTWSRTTCNCPTSGSWAGSCSDGKTTTLNITGCGTATYTEGSDTEAVTFDRCAGT